VTQILERNLRPVGTMIQTHAWKNTTPFYTVDIPAHEDSFMAWEGHFGVSGHGSHERTLTIYNPANKLTQLS
jgi:hypothetical protein